MYQKHLSLKKHNPLGMFYHFLQTQNPLSLTPFIGNLTFSSSTIILIIQSTLIVYSKHANVPSISSHFLPTF